MWHVKGGLGGVKAPGVREMGREALQETDLVVFRCIVSSGAVRLGHLGAWAARKECFQNRPSSAIEEEGDSTPTPAAFPVSSCQICDCCKG